VIVILGRQQLFTKNTLTVILPLLRKKNARVWINVARLWAVVLTANLIGAFIFAWLIAVSNVFGPELRNVFNQIGHDATQATFATVLMRGIVSGWLIALMVWLLPFAEAARLWVVIILAYLIGLAELPHVVAGSVEAFFLVSTGALAFWVALGSYVLPAFIGNVIGGVALVGVGAHAEFFEAEKESD
jgi:formate/nitrite transporter FocA (FNT family)